MGKLKSVVIQNKTPIREFAGQCGLACMIASIMTLALLGVLAAIRININMPFSAHQPLTTILAASSTLAAAYMVSKKRKRTGLVLGACTGFFAFVLVTVLSVIILGEAASGQIYVKLVALVSAGGLGGLIGASKGSKQKKLKF